MRSVVPGYVCERLGQRPDIALGVRQHPRAAVRGIFVVGVVAEGDHRARRRGERHGADRSRQRFGVRFSVLFTAAPSGAKVAACGIETAHSGGGVTSWQR